MDLCGKVVSYKLGDQTMSSYPSDSYDVKYHDIYYGFPVTVKKNVRKAHSFIYQTEHYEMTDELRKIAKKSEDCFRRPGFENKNTSE